MHSNISLPWPWLYLFSFISFSSTSFAVPLCHSVLSPCVSSPLPLWLGCGMSPKVHIFDHLVPSWWWCLGRLQILWEVGLWVSEGWVLRLRALSHFLFHLCFVTSLDVSKHPLPQYKPLLQTLFASMMNCFSSNSEPKSSFSPTYFLLSGHFYNSSGNRNIATMTGPQQTGKLLNGMRLSL